MRYRIMLKDKNPEDIVLSILENGQTDIDTIYDDVISRGEYLSKKEIFDIREYYLKKETPKYFIYLVYSKGFYGNRSYIAKEKGKYTTDIEKALVFNTKKEADKKAFFMTKTGTKEWYVEEYEI